GGVDWQMRLEEPPVRLRCRDLQIVRFYARIDPRRVQLAKDFRIALEDELPDDLLHPGRARLRPSTNDNIVIAEIKPVPARRIDDPMHKLARLHRPNWGL